MKKVKRDAFLYLEPTEKSYGDKREFAQCSSCMMWTGDLHQTCTIHGKNVIVGGFDTCGFYVNGEPMPSMAGKEHESVTTKESGFEARAVRCENCRLYTPKEGERGICEGFKLLNTESPDNFDMNPDVHKYGCCNANVPIEKEEMAKGGLIDLLQKKLTLKQLFQ